MLKRTCKPFYSKLNARLEQDALRLDKAGRQEAAIVLLDQSDRLLRQFKQLPRVRRRRLKQELKSAQA